MNMTTVHLENLEKCFPTQKIFFNLTHSNDNFCQLESQEQVMLLVQVWSINNFQFSCSELNKKTDLTQIDVGYKYFEIFTSFPVSLRHLKSSVNFLIYKFNISRLNIYASVNFRKVINILTILTYITQEC